MSGKGRGRAGAALSRWYNNRKKAMTKKE